MYRDTDLYTVYTESLNLTDAQKDTIIPICEGEQINNFGPAFSLTSGVTIYSAVRRLA